MQPSFGGYVRHLRRERSLTQAELGAGRYSKSYVSALERGSIVPSRDALYFFAEQLAQPVVLFERMLQQERQEHLYLHVSAMAEQNDKTSVQENQQEVVALVNLILAGTNPSAISLAREIIAQDGGGRDGLPLIRQARVTFLQGLIAQETGDLSIAQRCFEYALGLVPAHQQAAIFDALGTNSSLKHIYVQAIYYHRRALHALQQNTLQEHNADLLLLTELHCGHDYRALGMHDDACNHYEQARRHLCPTHHLLLASQLYLGLGYCTYAAFYQHLPANGDIRQSSEEGERVFQQAISFLIQSKALYQASHDTVGITRTRLLQVMIQLDFSEWRKQVALEKARVGHTQPVFTCVALLEDVKEQCYQVLMEWQESFSHGSAPTKEVEALLYSALAYLIRFYVQRSELARLEAYQSTAMHDLLLAADLCQRVINTLSEPGFSWSLIQQVLTLSDSSSFSSSPALPRTPDGVATGEWQHNPLSLAEIYGAAGQVAEEIGRLATIDDFAAHCYKQADQHLQMALHLHLQAAFDQDRDRSYLVRCYQSYIAYLRERVHVVPAMMEEIYPVLLKLLNEVLIFVNNSDGLGSEPL